MTSTSTCIDGGARHAWHNTGLDIVGDLLVFTARCAWCGREAARKSPGEPQDSGATVAAARSDDGRE